jgi:hypothetical protein
LSNTEVVASKLYNISRISKTIGLASNILNVLNCGNTLQRFRTVQNFFASLHLTLPCEDVENRLLVCGTGRFLQNQMVGVILTREQDVDRMMEG